MGDSSAISGQSVSLSVSLSVFQEVGHPSQSVSHVSRSVGVTGWVFTAVVTRCDSSAISGQSVSHSVSHPVIQSSQSCVRPAKSVGQWMLLGGLIRRLLLGVIQAICSYGAFWKLEWLFAWRNVQIPGGWDKRMLVSGVSMCLENSDRRPMATYDLCVLDTGLVFYGGCY